MKLISKLLIVAFLGFIVYACCKDEDTGPELTPIQDRSEQYVIDKAKIETYLQTHYIDDSATDPGTQEVFVKPIPENNPDNLTSMWDDTRRRTIYLKNDMRDFSVFPPALINDPVDYAVHYFSINPAAPAIEPNTTLPTDFNYENHAHVTDSLFLNYKGWKTRDNQVFDKAVTPVWFNLRSVVSGFRQISPYVKVGEFDSNSSSPIPFNNFGSVIVVIPSGLAYYANPVGSGLLLYENLVFQINALRIKRADWDNDGIPNIFDIKELNAPYVPNFFQTKTFKVMVNGSAQQVTQNMIYDLWTDNDTDGDGAPNFIDNDDDGDGVLTRREIRKKYGPTDRCGLPFWYDANAVFHNFYEDIISNNGKKVHLDNVVKYNFPNYIECAP